MYGVCAQIDYPNVTVLQLSKFIKGPDIPTGGMVCGMEGIEQYFQTGRGSVKIRGKAGIEQLKGSREQLVITEIPYNVNRAALEERIAQLVNEKIIPDIAAMRNASDEIHRIVIDGKREEIPTVEQTNIE